MNGPLLISLIPPELAGEAAKGSPEHVPVVAVLLLAGILLSLLLRPPRRDRE